MKNHPVQTYNLKLTISFIEVINMDPFFPQYHLVIRILSKHNGSLLETTRPNKSEMPAAKA